MEVLMWDSDYADDWDEFVEQCEQMQAAHDSGNCPDECIFCEDEQFTEQAQNEQGR